jgi:hypothetical protein
MSDIVFDRMMFDHLEQLTAKSDEVAYLRTQLQLLTDEVERLRLTDKERKTIGGLTKHHEFHPDDPDKRGRMTWISSDAAAVLRHLLERTK